MSKSSYFFISHFEVKGERNVVIITKNPFPLQFQRKRNLEKKKKKKKK